MVAPDPVGFGAAPTAAADTAPSDEDRPSRHAWLVAVSAGLGYLFDYYVVNIYSFVLPLIAVSFALSSTAQGVIGSILLAGYTLGTFVFGWAADRFGRRDTLGASGVDSLRARFPARSGNQGPPTGRARRGGPAPSRGIHVITRPRLILQLAGTRPAPLAGGTVDR